MEKKNVQMNVMVSPELLKMVRRAADGRQGRVYLAEKAVRFYLKHVDGFNQVTFNQQAE
jgi:hypothetical protein